jgi:hypothetical protein
MGISGRVRGTVVKFGGVVLSRHTASRPTHEPMKLTDIDGPSQLSVTS